MNKKIHFIGIGGAGMLPLAIHSKLLGHDVTGSDLSSENFHLLEKEGIFPQKGHKGFGTDTELVVYSSAVREDNYEMRLAAEKNIPRVKRAEFTGILTRDSHSVLVAGCHGKSTATVMLADMMNPLPPFFASAIAGAEAVSTESNYFKGTGTHIIIEADEYDRSFLKLFPKDLIVLNIDDDHLDIYKDIEGVKKGFAELAGKLTSGSFLVYNGDDENVRHAVEDSAAKKISFGLDENNDYYAQNIIFDNFRTSFGLYSKNGPVTEINYRYTGMHNVYNMLSCLSLLCAYGIPKEALSEAALRFSGLKRRQEIIYSGRDFTLIDEYGHHPTEIKCSLEGVRENSGKRIIVLFQPHLYSRTKYHAGGFAKSFSGADKVFISHIYPAREVCDGTVSSSMIYSAMEEKEKAKTAVFDNFDDLYSELVKTVLPGDLIMSMGAGEINKVLYRLKNEIISRQAEKLSRTVSHFRTNEPMSEHTYYKIGGPARFYAAPENESELISLFAACNEASVEYFILGKGSNILVSDRGFEGCVIDISAQMNKVSVNGTKMTVQAGAVMSKLAAEALKHSLSGLEALSGIPGTAGGAVVGNAGCYGSEMSCIVVGVNILEGGAIKYIGKNELEFGYRSSCIKGKPVTGITLELVPGSYDDIKNKTAEFIRARNSSQPMDHPSCGSVFKRPAVKSGEEPLYASKMIDECGLKGLRSGGAQISEKHAGFIINTGGANAKDVMILISIIKNSVFEKFGIMLEEEVIYVGF